MSHPDDKCEDCGGVADHILIIGTESLKLCQWCGMKRKAYN